MNFKALTRACVFSLSLSFLGFSSFEIKADLASDCVKSTQIAYRIKTIILNLFSSGNIEHLKMADTYLNGLNPSEPMVKNLLAKMKASWTTLMEKLRQTRRVVPSAIEPHLIAAFDKFGDDILALSREIRQLGNTPELIELATVLERIPQEVQQEFTGLSQMQKVRFGTNIWRAKL